MTRATFVPIALVLVVVTLLTALLSHLILHGEFEYSQWAKEMRAPLPPLTNLLKSMYPCIWLLPAGTMVLGWILGRRSEIRAPHVSWYASCVVLALFVWFMCLIVAFYLVYSVHNHLLH